MVDKIITQLLSSGDNFLIFLAILISGIVTMTSGLVCLFWLLYKEKNDRITDKERTTGILTKTRDDFDLEKEELEMKYFKQMTDKLEEIEKRLEDRLEDNTIALNRISEQFCKALELFSKQSTSICEIFSFKHCNEKKKGGRKNDI